MEQDGMEELMSKKGLAPILASVRCDYRRQLTYPDNVQIGARVKRMGKTSMSMDHVVFSESQQAIAAEGEAVVVVFDYKENRPRRIPQEVRAIIESIESRSF